MLGGDVGELVLVWGFELLRSIRISGSYPWSILYLHTEDRALGLFSWIIYDGTLMPQASIDKSPSQQSIEMLESLCHDKNNVVFLVSARSRSTLSDWFSPCENLGMAAEHGYFLRLNKDEEWEACILVADCSWKPIAEPVMSLYTETTDVSTIVDKRPLWFGAMRMQTLILDLAKLRSFLIIEKACSRMSQFQ